MRKALLSALPREKAGTSFTANISAPVGGLNTRDALSEMPPEDATTLDNWFPRAGECVLRGGSSLFAYDMTDGGVKSFISYVPKSGNGKLYAVTNDGIFRVDAGGSVPVAVQALTNGYINGTMFTNSAGTTYWWGVNGTDNAVYYNGVAWANPAITGVTDTDLIFPWIFKHRIFVIKKNSMSVFYLPVDSIAGAASEIPLGNIFKQGGYLMSGTSWSLDAGDGPDDLCVFITSEGELAVYKGTNPASAASWALVGVYRVGRPLGRRCFVQIGGDVGVLVESGFYPMSKLIGSGKLNYSSALSNKIQPTFTSNVASVGNTTQGWEATVYPEQDALLVNVPTSGAATQMVMNTITGAWCTFSGWNAGCFTYFENNLYYGDAAAGNVYKVWNGVLTADVSSDVVGLARQAWNYFGSRTKLKVVNTVRPLLAYDGNVELKVAISPDFESVAITSTLERSVYPAGADWDTADWNTSAWSTSARRFKLWRYANHHPGYALALWLQTASNNSTLSWSGTDFILTGGGAI